MRHTFLLCAIAISLSADTAAMQAPPANALPGPLRQRLNQDRFEVVTSVRGLPLGVRDGLQKLFGSAFLDIADPGAAFRAAGAVSDANLPTRRLVTAACSIDRCLIYYERIATAHSWHVALFHWTPAATRFEWGGTAPGDLKTFDHLRKAVLSGSITSAGSW
jgi:hypothetical protein